MNKIYQSNARIIAARILAIELGFEPEVNGQPGAAVAVLKTEGGEAFAVPTEFAEKNGVQVGGYLGLTPANHAVFIPAAAFERDWTHVGEVPQPADKAPAPEENGNKGYPVSYDFAAFVQYGINAGGNVVRGYPWSFEFYGRGVTHLSDDEYLIANGTPEGLRFGRGQTITVAEDGALQIAPVAEAAPAKAPAKPAAKSVRRKK